MTTRLLVVGTVVVVTVAIVFVMRRGMVLRRSPYRGPDLGYRVVLFASKTCASCAEVADRLEAVGVTHATFEWERQPEVFKAAGVERVPTIVVGGGENWRVVGIPSRRQLGMWLAHEVA